jgi:2-polyprenyl-3-methyl-5-hydroxy-6-metoxy-1,4-benzoquinol methylase
MISVNLLDMLKNQAIKIPIIKKIAKERHATGILNDPVEVAIRLGKISSLVESFKLSSGTCLEFGPGQTIDTIKKLKKQNTFNTCFAIDIEDYFGADEWRQSSVEYFDFNSIDSIKSHSVDFIYAFDVLEHVRNPSLFISEVRRLLAPNGLVYFSWDLRDHLNMQNEILWFEMHKYKKIIFELQMSNRSSYVNRLSKNQWFQLFDANGFLSQILSELKSDKAYQHFLDIHGQECAPSIDATYRIEALLRTNG